MHLLSHLGSPQCLSSHLFLVNWPLGGHFPLLLSRLLLSRPSSEQSYRKRCCCWDIDIPRQPPLFAQGACRCLAFFCRYLASCTYTPGRKYSHPSLSSPACSFPYELTQLPFLAVCLFRFPGLRSPQRLTWTHRLCFKHTLGQVKSGPPLLQQHTFTLERTQALPSPTSGAVRL